jgi:hypothetical protein
MTPSLIIQKCFISLLQDIIIHLAFSLGPVVIIAWCIFLSWGCLAFFTFPIPILSTHLARSGTLHLSFRFHPVLLQRSRLHVQDTRALTLHESRSRRRQSSPLSAPGHPLPATPLSHLFSLRSHAMCQHHRTACFRIPRIGIFFPSIYHLVSFPSLAGNEPVQQTL